MSLNQTYNINISTRTILKIIGIILLLLLCYVIKQVIGIVFIAWVLSSAIDPLVDRLQRYKIPRFVSILVIYLLFFLGIILVVTLFIPPLVQELTNLTKDLPNYYNSLVNVLDNFKKTGEALGFSSNVEKIFASLTNSITQVTGGLYNAAAGFLGGLTTAFAILVIVFYMTVQDEGIKNFIKSIVPINAQPYIIKKINQIQSKLGSWLWGQIILMFAVGLLTAIALKIIGFKYVLVLAIFAGLCEFIPIIGPIVAAIPAVLFSLADISTSPVRPLLIIIIYIVVQQIENQFLVPKVMNKAVGLNPIVVIITLLIGGEIGGLVGIILAIPAASIISIFLEDFFKSKNDESNKLEGEEYIKKINKDNQ